MLRLLDTKLVRYARWTSPDGLAPVDVTSAPLVGISWVGVYASSRHVVAYAEK
jgi:hypothetical protein